MASNWHILFGVIFPIFRQVNSWLWASRTEQCQASGIYGLSVVSKPKTDYILNISPHSYPSQELLVAVLDMRIIRINGIGSILICFILIKETYQ
jgi:hypothetical protein